MRATHKEALGLCLGASSISLVRVRASGPKPHVLQAVTRPHGGDPCATLEALLESTPGWRDVPLCATGRKLRNLVTTASISEPEAVELAAAFALDGHPALAAVLSAGGETFMAYGLDARCRVREIRSGGKCASGTGEFLAQQLGRMGLGVGDLEGMDRLAEPYAVSGRCSVFCKSDCTHALNKGAPRQSVVAGLGVMMAGKCMELLHGLEREVLLLVGGCAANPFLARFLGQKAPELVIPDCAAWFEALGAALWALERSPPPLGQGELFAPRRPAFAMLGPLAESLALVEFKDHPRDRARSGDEVLVGLDVGSTTTKGVVLRRSDKAVLAGEYLRTEGDPVGASRRVYASLAAQAGEGVLVAGLGVTGSGRAIAALHADATTAMNEIVAHAAAAAHYDPEVDTIFEIGGQDAKYTFLSGGHPCDSAMNEACSAGTGSFLEESAREALGVDTLSIADMALAARATPDFNDQCSAFIGSDVTAAVQEGLALEDILAGLVRSVCLNYVSRVKGSRPVGERVFMQGGVCYNKAVPAAMAMLTGKRIVVPPEPGLMGALGVALEVDRRLRAGLLEPGRFDLRELAGREAGRRAPFTCRGGRGGLEGCDRGCVISRIEVGGKVHPFGGVCNRFENLRQGRAPDTAALDMVQARQRLVFRDAPAPGEPACATRPVVGLSRSYLTNTYFPMFRAFFAELGFSVTLPDAPGQEGVHRMGSGLCHPAELAHCFMESLVEKRPDAVFLPHIRAVPASGGQSASCTCVLLQGEPYYLRAAFPELSRLGGRLLTPVLDFAQGLAATGRTFLEVARSLGADERAGRRAFEAGLEAQRRLRREFAALGREAVERLENAGGAPAVALFGRPYNAFAHEANKAVPEKLATRGALVIPCDVLAAGLGAMDGRDDFAMYWGMGRTIMATARRAAAMPGLYGVYVTNFSCGPDSFLLGYFREEMGSRPSLTLELDSHTADAGLETRLEAFLDIADNHRRQSAGSRAGKALAPAGGGGFSPARVQARGRTPGIVTSSGAWLPLSHPRVKLLIPSMNPWASTLAAAALESAGVRAQALPPATRETLSLGRGSSSCKECLPLQLTVGALLDHLEGRGPDEVTAYFMPGADGPCRFGQYAQFTGRLINRREITDAAVLSPKADNGYAGLSPGLTLAIWRGIVAGDLFEQARAALLAAARDPLDAVALLEACFKDARRAMRRGWSEGLKSMESAARRLAGVALHTPVEELPALALVGEIYVRHDPISRQGLVRRLAAKGFVVRTAPVSEWVFYTDWLQNRGITSRGGLGARFKQWFKRRSHAQALAAFARSGLIAGHQPDPEKIVRAGAPYISPMLTGEAILTVGAAFHEILAPACGVVVLGPFGCMPTRLAEAVLARSFDTGNLAALYPQRVSALPEHARGRLPLITVETDGNPFPQLVEAKLEAFCLQAMRLHNASRS